MRKEVWFGLSIMALVVTMVFVLMPAPSQMTNGHLGLLMLALIVVGIMLGFPTAFTLMGMGVFFGWLAYHSADPTTATIQFRWREAAAVPGSFFAEDGDRWFWPGPGVRLADRLVIFLSRVRATVEVGTVLRRLVEPHQVREDLAGRRVVAPQPVVAAEHVGEHRGQAVPSLGVELVDPSHLRPWRDADPVGEPGRERHPGRQGEQQPAERRADQRLAEGPAGQHPAVGPLQRPVADRGRQHRRRHVLEQHTRAADQQEHPVEQG